MSKNILGELTTTENLPKQRLLSDALSVLGLDRDMVGKAVEVITSRAGSVYDPLIHLY